MDLLYQTVLLLSGVCYIYICPLFLIRYIARGREGGREREQMVTT